MQIAIDTRKKLKPHFITCHETYDGCVWCKQFVEAGDILKAAGIDKYTFKNIKDSEPPVDLLRNERRIVVLL